MLVLGADGMLGHKLIQRLGGRYEAIGTMRGSRDDVPYCDVPFFSSDLIIDGVDATDFDALDSLLVRVAPDVVVNCVGVIKHRLDTENPIPSITANSLLPHILADRCAARGSRLIHLSTDCVFSGRRGDYREDDVADAVDLYGRTKYLGEVADRDQALTIRTSMVGRELTHFLQLMEWFLAQKGSIVRGFRRAIYSGVTTNFMARLIEILIQEHPRLHGLYHVAGPRITKFDLLCEVRQAFNIDVAIESDDEFEIDRSLNGERFAAVTRIAPPSWHEMIAEMAADETPYEEWR